jgi:pimeloyl-ACP methyl ester carboxylesterase
MQLIQDHVQLFAKSEAVETPANAAPVTWPERRAIKMWDGEASVLAWEKAEVSAASLLVAHANGFNALTYRSLIEGLTDNLRTYAVDFRGHGKTTLAANPKGMSSWQIYRDDLLRLVQELDGRPKILVGHSMGATVSLMAASARPEWATGLVLIEPVILPQRDLRWLNIARALGLVDRMFPMVAKAKRRRSIWPSAEAMFDAYRGRGAFRTWPEEVVRDYVEGGTVDYLDDGQVRLACTPGWEAANYGAGPPDVWDDIANLRCPTTLIVGAKRSTCSETVIATLLKARPDITVVRVGDASHFLPMEFPEIVRHEIRSLADIVNRRANA